MYVWMSCLIQVMVSFTSGCEPETWVIVFCVIAPSEFGIQVCLSIEQSLNVSLQSCPGKEIL